LPFFLSPVFSSRFFSHYTLGPIALASWLVKPAFFSVLPIPLTGRLFSLNPTGLRDSRKSLHRIGRDFFVPRSVPPSLPKPFGGLPGFPASPNLSPFPLCRDKRSFGCALFLTVSFLSEPPFLPQATASAYGLMERPFFGLGAGSASLSVVP